MDVSDQALLKRWIHERDEEAFLALATRHAGMVYAACRRILGDATEAEDVAQECFQTLATGGERHGAWLAAWLHRVATYRSLDRLRSERRRLLRETRYARQAPSATAPRWEDVYAWVDEAIADLPDRLRGPLTEHFLEGKTFEAIAEALGLTRQAVHARVQDGLDRVRTNLKRRGILVPAIALGALLSANAAEAAPPALLARLGKIALSARAIPAAGGLGSMLGHAASRLANTRLACAAIMLALMGAGAFYFVAKGASHAPAPQEKRVVPPAAVTNPAPAPPAPAPRVQARTPLTQEAKNAILTARIHGMVVLPDGTPVAGAHVSLKGDEHVSVHGQAFHAEMTSDANGCFDFACVPMEKVPLAICRLHAEKDNLFGGCSFLRGHQHRQLFGEAILYEDAPISGQVVDAEGHGIANAEIEARMASAGAPSFGWGPAGQQAKFDATGQFVLTHLFPGTYNLLVTAPGRNSTITTRYATGTRDVRVVLSTAIPVLGRIVEAATGAPVEGLRVYTEDTPHDFLCSRSASGADGAFEIDLGEGKHELRLGGGAYFPVKDGLFVDVKANEAPEELALEVEKGATIRGRLVNFAKRDADIFVNAKPEDPAGHERGARTNEDGTFEIQALRSGAYTIEAKIEGGGASKRIDVLAGHTYENIELEFVESPIVGAHGQVLDPEGQPVAFASVILSRPGTKIELWRLADEAGRFAIPDEEVSNTAKHPAYLQAVTGTAISAPAGPFERLTGKAITLRTEPAARIDGLLTDQRGRGIPNAAIVAVSSGAAGLGLIPCSVDARESIYSVRLEAVEGQRTTTFLQGRFTIWPLYPGSYTLCAFMAHSTADAPAASLRVTVEPGEERRDVTLLANTEGLGAVEGCVTRHGAPVVGQAVEAYNQYAYTGPDGRYRIENLPPGGVQVSVRNRRGWKAENILDKEVYVTIEAGKAAQADLPLLPGSASVEGTVLIDGQPGSPVEVSFGPKEAPDSEAVRAACDEKGYYKAEGLLPGEYRVAMMFRGDERAGRPGVMRYDEIALADGEKRRLDWRIESQGIKGSVLGLAPGEGAVLFLLPPETPVPEGTRLNAESIKAQHPNPIKIAEARDGAFAFDIEAPGDYLLVAAACTAGQGTLYEAADFERELDGARFGFAYVSIQAQQTANVDITIAP